MTTSTLLAAGQASTPLEVLDRETADWAVTSETGFTGTAWLQRKLDNGDYRNFVCVNPGDRGTETGPVCFRVWVEAMGLSDDLVVTATLNNDVLHSIKRADGTTLLEVRAVTGVAGLGVGGGEGGAGISTINGKLPEGGALELSAADVGAEPVGAADNAFLAAVAEATARIDQHKAEANPHGISKVSLGLGLVENIEPAEMPLSNPQATAIAAAVEGLLSDAPTDGVEYVRKSGVWAPATSGSGGTQTQIVTESEWAAIDPGTDGVVYHVVPDPAPTNLTAGEPTANAGFTKVGDAYVLQGTSNFDLTWPLSGLSAGHTYSISFGVENHIKANLTPGFTTDGTARLSTPTRQGTTSPGTTTTYTIAFSPTGSAPTAFFIRCNAQDGLALNAKIKAVVVYDLGPA